LSGDSMPRAHLFRLLYTSILEDVRMNSYGIFNLYPTPTPSMLTSIYYIENKLHQIAFDELKFNATIVTYLLPYMEERKNHSIKKILLILQIYGHL